MSDIRFWYAVGEVEQLAFDDRGKLTRPFFVEGVVGEGHMVERDMLLCRQGRDKLKNKYNAKKQKTVKNRIDSVPLCEKCQNVFKSSVTSPFYKWVKNSTSQEYR